jgi:hypothetical protein
MPTHPAFSRQRGSSCPCEPKRPSSLFFFKAFFLPRAFFLSTSSHVPHIHLAATFVALNTAKKRKKMSETQYSDADGLLQMFAGQPITKSHIGELAFCRFYFLPSRAR